jgi:hypothetical protein
MKCPRCVLNIHRGAENCPHCGFSLPLIDADFILQDLTIRAVNDRAGLMRAVERERVARAIERFCRRFPELIFCVHTAVFADVSHLRLFGFWILNNGSFADHPGRHRESAIVLTLDVERKAAGLSYGYHLEPYLDETSTFDCLCKAHPHWLEGKHDHGVIAVIKALEVMLRRASQQAGKSPEKFAKKVMPPAGTGELASRIRKHRRTEAAEEEEVS